MFSLFSLVVVVIPNLRYLMNNRPCRGPIIHVWGKSGAVLGELLLHLIQPIIHRPKVPVRRMRLTKIQQTISNRNEHITILASVGIGNGAIS